MPLIGTFGAGSAGGFGQRKGAAVPYFVRYLVVAGGGSGGYSQGGGGGGGGYREIACKTAEVITGTDYSILVGAGGTAASASFNTINNIGNPSTFDTIVSTGGGSGGGGTAYESCGAGAPGIAQPGGSGGGIGRYQNPSNLPAPAAFLAGGVGNSPPTSPSQGNPGGSMPTVVGNAFNQAGAGGGGSGSVGQNVTSTRGSNGGSGTTSTITGSPLAFSGGGAGGGDSIQGIPIGSPGGSGGGAAGQRVAGQTGGTNQGGGGGAAGGGGVNGGAGGSGKIVLRRLTAASCTTSGCVSTCGADTIHVFNSPGTYTA